MTTHTQTTQAGATPAVALLVDERAINPTKQFLITMMSAVTYGIWDNLGRPKLIDDPIEKPIAIFAEGQLLITRKGKVAIYRLSIRAMERAIRLRERGERNPAAGALDFKRGDDTAIFVFGSKRFCQATINFLAIRDDKLAEPWALRMIRRIGTMEQDHVVWTLPQESTRASLFGASTMHTMNLTVGEVVS